MCKKSLLMMLLLALLVPWAANAQTSLFSEDFEGGSMPAGWTTDGSGSWSVGVGDYSASTGAGHGSYNAKITHGSTGNVTKLITPEIDLSTVASAELSFMHVQRSWAGDIDQLRVYYRTSSSGSWTQIAEYTAAFASWTTEDGIILPDLSSTYQIAFEHTDMYGYGVGVDNIVIVQGASCPKPTGLAATANGQSATLTWIGDASSFHVAYSTDGTANPDELTYTTVNTNSYTKDNLALDADHYFWVRANCSATEQSNWAGPASVHIGYCVPAPTSVDGNGISNVTFGTGDYVVNNDTPKATYADYHTLIGAVQAGVEATIAITFKTSYTYNTYVWVDLDNSLSFDADEVVCYGESTSANPTTLTLSFTIPADQTLGDFRLRIGSADSGLGTDPAAANPCYSSSYGCFQDYTLRVLEAPSCLTPTGLAVNYTGGLTATATWDGTADTYNIDVNGNVTNNVTAPYTINGLELATTYAVRVQANCAGNETSDWSNPISFTTDLCLPENMCELTFVLNDSYGDGWSGSVINVIDVATGSVIAAMAANNHNVSNTPTSDTKTLNVCDGRELQFVWVNGGSSWDNEASYVVTDINGEVIFEGSGALSEPVNYTVDCPSCITPKNFTVSDITAHGATLSWTSAAESWQVDCNGEIIEVRQNSTELRLEPDTQYTVKVRAFCGGEDYSEWTNPVTFTTLPTCYAPTDMVISDITAYTANIGWTSDNTNFDMRYAVDVRLITTFDDSQMHNWTNIDADGDGYEWVLGSECGGIYLVEGGSLAGSGHNSSADMVTSGSYSNATNAALTPDNYLVSPQITLGGSISFWAQAQDASYAAEHFGVAVSTTGNTDAADFTTIAEWTIGSRSANVLRSSNAPRGGNRDQSEWVLYTVDLSAYSGQGYVAIRHFDCTDMFMLNVDDIFIEQPGFELPWVYVTNPTNPQALTNLEPETNYLVQVRANCGAEDGYSRWLEGSFTTLPACMVPTNLVVSNIDKRSADLAWTSNGEETAWQICVNGDETNLIDVTDTTYYSFTGLEPSTNYSVKVRAYCDEQLQSAWSTPTTFTTLVACPAPTNLAISNITNVSAVASWTGEGDFELQYAEDVWTYYDNGVYALTMGAGGTIYWGIMLPAESLTAGEPLTKVALHTTYAGEAEMNIYLGGDQPTGTPAATQTFTMAGDGDFMEITLDTPVAIDGTQNLWITFYQSGLTYPADGCTGPTDPNGRWVSLDGETWSDIADYGYDYTWMIRAAFGNNTQTEWVTIDNATSPQAITGLTPETNYLVRVKHVCGGIDGESVWVTTSFTTDVACPAPYALAATPYANSAELSWEGTSESYTVSYRTAAYTEGISEEFATSSMPTGWAMYTGLLSSVMEGTASLTTTSYAWTFGTGNGVFDSHARVNIYSTSCKYWLVTPAMEVPTGAEFSFDLALTNYNGTLGAPATTGTDDKFVVLVSTDNMATWTILRQWDNAGSEYVYNNIANTATGENVSFDFRAYAGQTVYVAFYGESTESNADNNLHIDNVAIGTPMPAGEWQTANADEAAATLTGLTPATKYEWKVQGDCGDFGMSEESAISSFTTTEDTCPMPTNLTVDAETLTFNTADLSWNGSPDVESFTVRYRVPEHAAAGSFYETFDVNSIPAGWMKYSGLVDDVVAGTATLTSTTSGWNFSNTNVFGQYHAKVNIYGTSCKYWLVTPEVTLTNGNLNFDLALTGYNSANAASGSCDDDRFVVLVYANNAWTILREWNNRGSEYVYNTIATTGETVSIDLSAYVGQAVQIAFYGESTVTSNGDNDLHIDNVLIGTLIPATDWQMVEGITDMNVTLTGLTPETLYEAQVKSDCSDPEAWSNTVNFTTLEYVMPTQTIALTAGANWVAFNVEITLNDLKAALVAALPGANNIVIKSRTQNTRYNGSRWLGTLTWDLSQMYIINVPVECEITMQGDQIDPSAHPATIKPGANWIAYPLTESMSLTNAFAGFAMNYDVVKSRSGNAQYNRGRWQGSTLTTLEPGKGYLYISPASENRTLVFPTPAK